MNVDLAAILAPTPAIAAQLEIEREAAVAHHQAGNALDWLANAIRDRIVIATSPATGVLTAIVGPYRVVLTHDDMGRASVSTQDVATDRMLATLVIDPAHRSHGVAAELVERCGNPSRSHR